MSAQTDNPSSYRHTPNSGNLLGDEIPTVEGHQPSYNISLVGRFVTIVPVSVNHAEELYSQIQEEKNASLFDYLFEDHPKSLETWRSVLETKATATNSWTYTILHNRGAGEYKAVGLSSLMRMDLPNRVIEIGGILFTPALQRTPAATEAMYLFAKYVFETLGFRRYEWKCNSLNEPSRRAATRLGFTFEGIFRQHMIIKGRNRDTAWFSMLNSEWPSLKTAFEEWLRADNFDGDGRQKKRLHAEAAVVATS